MSALDELTAGAPGADFVELLRRVIRAVGPGDGFPPPEGHDRWDGSALMTCIADFFASTQTERRLKDLSTCPDEQALKAKLHRTIRNFLADQGRKTTVGRLVLRFNEVLGRTDGFDRQGPFWGRTGEPGVPAEVDRDALIAAIADVEVVVPAAYSTGDRKSPELDAPSVVRITDAAITAAGGTLTPAVLADVAAVRLGIRDLPLSLDATAFSRPAQVLREVHDAIHVDALLADRVAQVLSRLDERHLVTLGAPKASSVELGGILGVSPSMANKIKNRAIAVMSDELAGEDGGQLVANAVLDLARSWLESWMINDDPT